MASSMSYVQWTLPVLASRQWTSPARSAITSRSSLIGGHAQRAVHGLLEVELAVAVGVEAGVVPDGGRVGIGPDRFAGRLVDRLEPPRRHGLALLVDDQLRAHVAALAGIDAPQVARAFAVLGVLARWRCTRGRRRSPAWRRSCCGRRGRRPSTPTSWGCSRTSRAAWACRRPLGLARKL